MAEHEHKKIYRALKGHTYLEALGDRPSGNIIAVKTGNRLHDLRQVADSDVEFQAVYLDSDDGLKILRHSAAHLLAHVITSLYPDSRPNAGPATEDGFYYDFDMKPISSDQFPSIEEKMREIAGKNYPIVREEYEKSELISMFSNNP
ncbi:MAG: threonine--tRNA ligase, partial [Thermoplasmataceae archaeon]